MEIFFYKVNDEFGCFSNFSPHGFEFDGVWEVIQPPVNNYPNSISL
ncbi:hypothetical protein [Bacillus sp. SM2101]|nr:hypothetical protein [Bacillus sp. SM2101]